MATTRLAERRSATTSISNSGTLKTAGGGIYGAAREYAEAFGNTTPAAGKSYSASGGVAPATVSISNSGNMTSLFGVGGYAKAGAGAIGFVAKGGTATATTTVSNTGNLVTHYTGVFGSAVALSDTIGGTTKGGSATGGTSSATVKISNTGNITAGNGSPFADGIYGNSFASASGGLIVIPIIRALRIACSRSLYRPIRRPAVPRRQRLRSTMTEAQASM